MEIPRSSFSVAQGDDDALVFCDAISDDFAESDHDSEADAVFYEVSGDPLIMLPPKLVTFFEYINPDKIDEFLAHHDYYEILTQAIYRCAEINRLHLLYSYQELANSVLTLTQTLFSSPELHDSYKLDLNSAQTSSAAPPPLAQTSSAALDAPKPALPEASLATLSGHTVAMAGSRSPHNSVNPINSYLHYLYLTAATNLNSFDKNSNSSHFSVLPLTECMKS